MILQANHTKINFLRVGFRNWRPDRAEVCTGFAVLIFFPNKSNWGLRSSIQNDFEVIVALWFHLPPFQRGIEGDFNAHDIQHTKFKSPPSPYFLKRGIEAAFVKVNL